MGRSLAGGLFHEVLVADRAAPGTGRLRDDVMTLGAMSVNTPEIGF